LIFFLAGALVVLAFAPRFSVLRAALEGNSLPITGAVGTSEPGIHRDPIGTSEPGIHREPIGTSEPGIHVEIIPGTPEATAQPVETIAPGSAGNAACTWTETFQDNFNGDSLDLSKWLTDYPAGEKEKQNYVADAFSLKDGILQIKAEKREVDGRNYASGILTTRQSFKQQYGLFEIRAKVPHGQGLWPAFWMLPATKNFPWEMDVFEVLGDDTQTVYMSHHWKDDKGEHIWDTERYQGEDISKDFHTFALEWTDKELVWFIDGKERNRSDQADVPAAQPGSGR
jgi:beta-glucanase (GH16 family)